MNRNLEDNLDVKKDLKFQGIDHKDSNTGKSKVCYALDGSTLWFFLWDLIIYALSTLLILQVSFSLNTDYPSVVYPLLNDWRITEIIYLLDMIANFTRTKMSVNSNHSPKTLRFVAIDYLM